MKNVVEELTLKDQFKNVLEEARVVLPGIQALFGFQLIAVFNSTFDQKLSASEQKLHLVALSLTAVSVILSMMPAAVHRQAQPTCVSARLVRIATILLTVGMAPLLVAINLDFYVICHLILKDASLSLELSLVLGLAFAGAWYAVPWSIRKRLGSPD